MNRELIIKLAKESGFDAHDMSCDFSCDLINVEKFAELVAAHEREACAMICEKQIKSYMSKKYSTDPLCGYRERFAANQCAEAIRARGKK